MTLREKVAIPLALVIILGLIILSVWILTGQNTIGVELKSTIDYIPDGTSADEFSFQRALDSLPTTGGTIYIIGGNFTR